MRFLIALLFIFTASFQLHLLANEGTKEKTLKIAAAVWAEQAEHKYRLLFMQQLQNENQAYWTDPTVITETYNFISNPTLLLTDAGEHIVFWVDNSAAPALIFYSQKKQTTSSWSKPTSISSTLSDVSSIAVIGDTSENVHLFFVANQNQQDDLFSTTFYKQKDKWGAIKQVNPDNEQFETNPESFLMDTGHIAIRWQVLDNLGKTQQHLRILADNGLWIPPKDESFNKALNDQIQQSLINQNTNSVALPVALEKRTITPGTSSVILYPKSTRETKSGHTDYDQD